MPSTPPCPPSALPRRAWLRWCGALTVAAALEGYDPHPHISAPVAV